MQLHTGTGFTLEAVHAGCLDVRPRRRSQHVGLQFGDTGEVTSRDARECADHSLNAFTNAGLRFDELKSIFITHLHTEHIVDYFSFFLSGGYTASKGKAPVAVYGPGPAGGLPPSQVGNPDPATIDSKDPAPGLAATTTALQQAFAYTNNILIRDMGIDDIGELAEVTEIAVPPGMAAASRRFWSQRLELDRTILRHAYNRGEITAATQHRPAIEALLGPLYFRLLVTGEPLDDRFIEGIVDLVCAACTAN